MIESKPTKRKHQRPGPTPRKSFTFRLEPTLIYRLRLLADDTNTTVSALMAYGAQKTIDEVPHDETRV